MHGGWRLAVERRPYIRAGHLEKIGGFATESVTEDFLCTFRMSEAGFKTVYLSEPLSEGLAAEGLAEYIVQRGRWALGTMQIFNVYNPFSFMHRLCFRQRLSLLDSFLYWVTTFPWRLVTVFAPILFWWFGLRVVHASAADFFHHFLPSFFASTLTLNWIGKGFFVPLIPGIAALVPSLTICRAITMGLFTKGPHKFRVTAKGADRNAVVVHWSIMKVFAIPLVLTAAGLALPLLTDYSPTAHAGDEDSIMLLWSLYSIVSLGVTMLVCIERPRPLHTMRNPVTEVGVAARSGYYRMWLKDLSADGATLRGVRHFAEGETVRIQMPYVGELPATATRVFTEGATVTFAITDAQRALLLAKLHAEMSPASKAAAGEPALTGAST